MSLSDHVAHDSSLGDINFSFLASTYSCVCKQVVLLSSYSEHACPLSVVRPQLVQDLKQSHVGVLL